MLGYYRSITGLVKVKILDIYPDKYYGCDFVCMKVTSRKNPYYPEGYVIEAPNSLWITDREFNRVSRT